MNQHSRAYEQYCSILQKNIVMEETVFHNGTKKIRCTNYISCTNNGGCKNGLLRNLWESSAFPKE